MDITENSNSFTMTETSEERRYTALVNSKRSGYNVHPLDELVTGRLKTVRITAEDGTVTKARIEVAYKKPRYERTIPFVNLGKKYPSHGKKRGGNVTEVNF